MPAIAMLVDFDNIEASLVRSGAVSLTKLLISTIPSAIWGRYDSIQARLYGGWRLKGALTTGAQKLTSDILKNSPTVVASPHSYQSTPLRLTVELAQGPMGSNLTFEETFVRERELRKFRVRKSDWAVCANPGKDCGLGQFATLSHDMRCSDVGCQSCLGDILVRDEQKMVDTLMVADIAYQALILKATDIIVVSSDTDMWPGVLLAIQTRCNIIHLHTRQNWRTQNHLVRTLSTNTSRFYQQFSIT